MKRAKRTNAETMYFYDNWVIPIIRDEYDLDEEQAARRFLFSETYKMLADEELKLFRESPLVIFDMYENEVKTGNPRNSTYIIGDAMYAAG